MFVISTDILSPLKNVQTYLTALEDKKSFIQITDSVLSVKAFQSSKKDILNKSYSFQYVEALSLIMDIIQAKDLLPICDDCCYELEWLSGGIPVDLIGYYGRWDADITIDDLTAMTAPEFIAVILLRYSDFVDFLGEESIQELITAIPDENIREKVLELINNYELKDVYMCFKDDVKAARYKDNSFIKNLAYLFDRLCQNTDCPFIDIVPDMNDTPIHWGDLEYWIDVWTEQKKLEKKWRLFVTRLNEDLKFQKKFYKTLFEIVNRYKSKKKIEGKNGKTK
jgi:hypothetical protein